MRATFCQMFWPRSGWEWLRGALVHFARCFVAVSMVPTFEAGFSFVRSGRYAYVSQAVVCRDFMGEIGDILTTKDPCFNAMETALWNDHVEKKVAPMDVALVEADSRLQCLSDDARKKAWEHDTLQLARDVASLAKLYSHCEKGERADRLKRITHIRSENTIGGSIVDDWMAKNACCRAGTESDLLNIVEQVFGGHSQMNYRVFVNPYVHCQLIKSLVCCSPAVHGSSQNDGHWTAHGFYCLGRLDKIRQDGQQAIEFCNRSGSESAGETSDQGSRSDPCTTPHFGESCWRPSRRDQAS